MEGKNDPAEGRVETSSQGPPEWPLPRSSRRDHALDPTIQAHLGRRLKAVYDDVLRQPVPDRFVELLTQLDLPKDENR